MTSAPRPAGLRHLHGGKVRDLYDAGDDRLLMVASDRISAFDVVMAETIPDKGRVLTAMTAFWLERLGHLAPSHLVSTDPADFPAAAREDAALAGRAMLVRRADMVKLEFIVRGYLAGSAWREYRRAGTVHGTPLPSGLAESARLPEPAFTPSTKAEVGHDENIGFDTAAQMVGRDVASAARQLCVSVYTEAARLAEGAGIIIADTKFELGFLDGALALCDEVLTPDSSRFWEAAEWQPGTTPASFDQEPLRRWLATLDWDQRPPPPPLPPEVVEATRRRYVGGYERITGRRLADWFGGDAP
ncbi:MAG: phosphoribosylaminoimidazolesuccinocarboxamide synthase [Acidimicrobiales bacterium]